MPDPAIVQMTVIEPPERTRTYHYADGTKLTLANVTAAGTRPSGTHRLTTADGRKWVVAAGWRAIELDIDKWTF